MEFCMSLIVVEVSCDVALIAKPTSMFVPFSGSEREVSNVLSGD